MSGGVDSMVMLTWFVKNYPSDEVVVASFDHGARESAARDVEFVSEVCSALQIRFYGGKLGPEGSFLQTPEGEILRLSDGFTGFLSEEAARKERYKFLFRVAFLEKGEIYTAQHLDDLVESICINLLRGTGFRGLAPMTRWGVRRPFLEEEFAEKFLSFVVPTERQGCCVSKKDILRYAAREGVMFREDPSNSSDDFLRNRIRKRVRELDQATKLQVFELWRRQKKIVREIERICESIIPEDLRFEREMFRKMPVEVSEEVLREGLTRAGCKTTRPQRREFLEAILAYETGKKFNLPGDKLVEMRRDCFQL
ncbi:MAG: tRNA lysidine(34) synthetase TilS [bacterium]|nr:tRNA lysidine(34) synthetase TilS [bacterium]